MKRPFTALWLLRRVPRHFIPARLLTWALRQEAAWIAHLRAQYRKHSPDTPPFRAPPLNPPPPSRSPNQHPPSP